jgi:hypothetical protein
MRIKKVLVEVEVEEKILFKHRVRREELERAFACGRVFRVKGGTYLLVAHQDRYVTVIFDYEDFVATVRTAYPSGKDQIRRYQKK